MDIWLSWLHGQDLRQIQILKERKTMQKTTWTYTVTYATPHLFSFTGEKDAKEYLRGKIIAGELTSEEAKAKLAEWRNRSEAADNVLK
jgi:hypothetical protein